MRDFLLSFIHSIQGEWWAPIAFLVVYTAVCGVGLPGLLLTLSGGALFGTFPGTLYNWVGATLGASIAFGLSRKLGRDYAERILGKSTLFKKFDGITARHGFHAVLTLRLIPICPFNGINLGAGISKIEFRDFLIATAIGILPSTFIYTYFADSLLSGVVEAKREAFRSVLTAGTLLVLLSFLPTLYRRYVSKV